MTRIGKDFLNRTHKALTIKEKIDKLEYNKLFKNLKLLYIKRVQRQTVEREHINWGRKKINRGRVLHTCI